MNNRILFIYPIPTRNRGIPLAISILGGIAKARDFEVELFDCYKYSNQGQGYELDRSLAGEFRRSQIRVEEPERPFTQLIEDLQVTLDRFQPGIIAISCNSYEYEYVLSFWPSLTIPESSLVIMGGVHAILNPDQTIESGLFDLVCIGEGEDAFAEMLDRYSNQESLDNIGNMYFRDRETCRIVNNNRIPLLDEKQLWQVPPLDTMFDDHHFLLNGFDSKPVRRYRIEAGRGCPYSCSYCANDILKRSYEGLGKFVRVRPVSSLMEHIRTVIDRHGIESFSFQDECFLAKPDLWIKEFAVRYEKDVGLPFNIQTRVETVNPAVLETVKRMSVDFQVTVGVESGSEYILKKLLKRNIEISQTVAVFDLLHQAGVRTAAQFMIGLPYETREDIFKTIQLCRRIKPDIATVNIYQPIPGQRLRDVCLDAGFISGREPLQSFHSGSILKMPQITSQELVNLRRVFVLYAYLPEKYYPDIKRCEDDYPNNRQLFEGLIELRWSLQ